MILPPTILILASGRGERLRAAGGTTHKLQALLGERTVLQHTLAAAQALRQVIRAHAAFLLPLEDIGCVTDIDTPGDLAAAHGLLQNRP